MCFVNGGPLALIGLRHLLFPESAWSGYRGWGKFRDEGLQETAPDYQSGNALRVIRIAMPLSGILICVIPRLLGD